MFDELILEESDYMSSYQLARISDFVYSEVCTINQFEQLDKSKEENFDLSNIYNQSIMRYQQLFSSTITITVAGDFSLHAGDAIWVDIAGLKANTEADDINEEDGGVYIISDLSHYVSLKETYTKMNLIRDSTGREGNHTTLKAHTVTRDNFLSNIK